MASAASYRSVAVIGAGAWGTALASAAARAGRAVTLYARDPARFAQLTVAIEKARAERDTAEERWLELAEQAEALQA